MQLYGDSNFQRTTNKFISSAIETATSTRMCGFHTYVWFPHLCAVSTPMCGFHITCTTPSNEGLLSTESQEANRRYLGNVATNSSKVNIGHVDHVTSVTNS